MYQNGKANTYQATQVSTTSGAKLILLMYDGAIRFIREAIQRLNSRDIAGYGANISKAQKIVAELENSLDKGRGGQVAAHLQKSYIEIAALLTRANISGEAAPLQAAERMLSTLREAWDQVINSEAGQGRRTQSKPEAPSQVTINI